MLIFLTVNTVKFSLWSTGERNSCEIYACGGSIFFGIRGFLTRQSSKCFVYMKCIFIQNVLLSCLLVHFHLFYNIVVPLSPGNHCWFEAVLDKDKAIPYFRITSSFLYFEKGWFNIRSSISWDLFIKLKYYWNIMFWDNHMP